MFIVIVLWRLVANKEAASNKPVHIPRSDVDENGCEAAIRGEAHNVAILG
jgi:hypothetical protein